MKVGLFTLPLNDNYGGILQAYALQKFLRDRGHDVSHIEETNKMSVVYKNPNRVALWYYAKLLLGVGRDPNWDLKNVYRRNSNSSEIRRFVGQYIRRDFYENLREYKNGGYEVLVVGSDQIWRPQYYKQIEDAFLKFADNDKIRKVSYAPSFGTEKWPFSEQQTLACKALIKQFDAVSVREDVGQAFVREYLDAEAVHVIDPTMLLQKEDYIKLLDQKPVIKEKQMTSYILDMTDEKRSFLDAAASEKQLTHFELNLSNSDKKKSVEDWLRGFMEASFIITDSFHGCVFSILFQRPFIAIGNQERGMGRFTSLLKLFGLEQRLIYNINDFEKIYQSTIDWESVTAKLDNERQKADQFLKSQGL